MKISRVFTGFCPTLNQDYSIEVEYIDASTFNNNLYIQGLATCEYHAAFKCPKASECPIRAKAPKEINL